MLQLATIIFAQLTADLSQFSPRQGEPSTDEVRLRGDAKLVTKLKAELEKTVAALRDRRRAILRTGRQSCGETWNVML